MRTRRSLPVLGVVTSLVLGLVVAVAPHQATADVAGRGGDFVPLATPTRVVDTRTGLGGATGARATNTTTAFTMTGVAGVPATGVSAVLVDVTPIAPVSHTGMVLWEDGQPRPGTSSIVALGATVHSNAAIVPVSAAGKIALYNGGGATHVAIEIQGYFTTSTGTAGRGGFVPTAHTWVANTLTGVGAPKATVPANGSLTVQMPAVVPASATSAYLDITVYGPTDNGGLFAYPVGGTMGSTVVEFETGATSSGAAVKLGTDRKVVFVNKGGSPINLMIALEGYFSSDPATGAGLRKASGRLANAQTIPAQGTIDVQVAGRFGLPTRAVGAAAVNFTVYAGATGGGHLRVWPSNDPAPAPPHLYFNKGQQRADMAIVKPGPDGIIKVRNVSAAPITLYADLQAWFGEPLPQLPVQRFARASALQAPPATPGSQSTLEYSYVDNIGTLWHGHQPSADSFGSIQWTAVPSNDAFTGTPVLMATTDSKVEVVAQALDGDLWSIKRQTAAPPAWTPWTDEGGSMASSPAVGKQADGANVLFATDADGKLWHYTNATWRSLGDADLVGTPTVELIRDGLQVFAVNTSGQLVTAAYRSGTLSAWTNLGGTGLNGTPAVVRYPGYLFRVFVRAGDGTIVTNRQDTESGPYSADWQALSGQAAAGSPAAVLSPALGTTEVVIRGEDGHMYSTGETAQGSGTWRAWQDITLTPDDLPATDPALVTYTNSSGANWGVMFRTINNRPFVYQYQANTAFAAHALPTP